MNHHSEKNRTKEENERNYIKENKLLNISSEIEDIRNEIIKNSDEINHLHKSVANLRPDIRQARREELKAALNGGIQG